MSTNVEKQSFFLSCNPHSSLAFAHADFIQNMVRAHEFLSSESVETRVIIRTFLEPFQT